MSDHGVPPSDVRSAEVGLGEAQMRCIVVDRPARGVCRITLARPEIMNAVDDVMRRDLMISLQAAIADDSVRVIVLTGAGPHFSAGGDITFLQALDAQTFPAFHRDLLAFVRCLAQSPKPTVSAVRGVCAGGAVGFALACDYLVASRTARFGVQFMRIGLTPDMGVAFFLRRRIGAQAARRLILDDRVVKADETDAFGLCDRLVEDEDLERETVALAERLADLAPQALRRTRWLLDRADGELDAFLGAEIEAAEACLGAAEFREGVSAFLEKRKPDFA